MNVMSVWVKFYMLEVFILFVVCFLYFIIVIVVVRVDYNWLEIGFVPCMFEVLVNVSFYIFGSIIVVILCSLCFVVWSIKVQGLIIVYLW